jgi:hypothetical protein
MKKVLPFVSVCTATYNRRPFILNLIEIYMKQTYPKDKMEWIIIDDGEDKVKDIFDKYQEETNKSIKNLLYLSLDEKITIGKKRNLLNRLSNGEIIIYMDDDDYYYEDRILYSVKSLINSNYNIAGCSELYCYNYKDNSIYKFGPYHENHCTAATMCFKKKILNDCCYDETKEYAEESSFLNNYSLPILQLDTLKCIMVINHNNNTCKRDYFIDNCDKLKNIQKINKNLNDYIKNEYMLKFYMNIDFSVNIDNNITKKLYYKNKDGSSRLIKYHEMVLLVNDMKKVINTLREKIKNN